LQGGEGGSVVGALSDVVKDGGFALPPEADELPPMELATECCRAIQDVLVVATVEMFRAGPSEIECTLLALSRPNSDA